MPKFFTDEISEDTASITGEDAAHISLSLRMRPGELLIVCDGRGMDYHCRIRSVRREQVSLDILSAEPSPGEPGIWITLFQAVCKGDKFEQVVQKAVELGVSEIVPVLTSRCVSRPDARAQERRAARYARIALEAAKQCGRGRIPDVRAMIPLGEMPRLLPDFDLTLFFYEKAQRPLSGLSLGGAKRLALIVGAEGGFDEAEADNLIQAGAASVSLGKRILRCETAPVAALAAILFAVGEM